MINRDSYLSKLISNINNGFPKIITGIRRCGKSYLLETIFKQYLLEHGVSKENIFIIDLDRAENYKYHDPFELLDYVKNISKNSCKNYVIIDEIQNIVSMKNLIFTNGKHLKCKPTDEDAITFAHVILSLSKLDNIDLYVTGSNSKMLSKDIQTSFRDKAVVINLNPLSFEEYINYKKCNSYEAVQEYLLYGGMPLSVLKEKEEDKKDYLKNLFEITYLKDIVERYKFKKEESINELSKVLATVTGNLVNSDRLVNRYKLATENNINKDTITSYLNAFEDSFIIRQAQRYDLKGKNIIGSSKKYYFTDLGLRNARLNFAYFDEGQLLENMVYNELIYNGYSVNIGTFDIVRKNSENFSYRQSLEVDFLAEKGNKIFYIQVCSDLSNDAVKNREIKPYIYLNDQIQKIIVVNKPLKECHDINGFTIIGIEDFLLRFIK